MHVLHMLNINTTAFSLGLYLLLLKSSMFRLLGLLRLDSYQWGKLANQCLNHASNFRTKLGTKALATTLKVLEYWFQERN